MNKKVLTELQQQLLARQSELSQRIAEVTTNITQEHSTDWSEQAQERQNDEVLEEIGNESRHELQQIHHAIERINNGTYMLCSECGAEINPERLKAVPYPDLCIKCASAAD